MRLTGRVIQAEQIPLHWCYHTVSLLLVRYLLSKGLPGYGERK